MPKSTVTDFRTKSHKCWLRHMSLQVIFLGILIFGFEYTTTIPNASDQHKANYVLLLRETTWDTDSWKGLMTSWMGRKKKNQPILFSNTFASIFIGNFYHQLHYFIPLLKKQNKTKHYKPKTNPKTQHSWKEIKIENAMKFILSA